MFLLACVLVFVGMFLFGPDELKPMQHRALGVTSSILIGFLAYFFCGSLKGVAESDMSGYAKVGICLVAAIVATAVAFGLWELGLAPVARSGD